MIKFEKVSAGQWEQDGGDAAIYDGIILPRRASVGSAGYDFFAASDFSIPAGESVKILTGIRTEMPIGLVLMIFPRSSLGFKYRLALDNTVGVIDSDYYGAKNEGHIQIKMTNNSDKDLTVSKGAAFAQGIFMQYFLTDDDITGGKRTGGFGSSDGK